VATYLAALDQLFDKQANLLREQTHRAEQAELAVRLQQIRAAQAEARAAAAVSSEAVAQESLRQARDRRMQEWTQSGTPEDGEQGLLTHSAPEEGSPHE
jgi:hypothetical protein